MHDHQRPGIAPPIEQSRAGFFLLSALIVLLSNAFFVSQADWNTSTYIDYSLSPDEVAAQFSAGRLSRQIAIFAMGMAGILMFILPGHQRIQFANLPVALLCLYILLSITSLLWTEVPWLTTKRLGMGVFGLMAIFGAARHLSLRDLIDVALGIGSILLVISVYAELRLGTFAPLAGEYRFAGILHPNEQGAFGGVMVIAAFFGMKAADRGKHIYLGFLIAACMFLLLTKSRTSVAACLCSISVAWYLAASKKQQISLGLVIPAAACIGLMTLLLMSAEKSGYAISAANLGRNSQQDFLSFNGRMPLWENLIERIAERPLLGYGYQGFWTEDRIYEVSRELYWSPSSAHSVPLEVLLSSGLIGGVIFGLAIIVTALFTVKRYAETLEPTDGFVFAMLVFALIGSFSESTFYHLQPNVMAFFTGVASLHVFSRRSESEPELDIAGRDTELLSSRQAASEEGLT